MHAAAKRGNDGFLFHAKVHTRSRRPTGLGSGHGGVERKLRCLVQKVSCETSSIQRTTSVFNRVLLRGHGHGDGARRYPWDQGSGCDAAVDAEGNGD